MTRAVDQALELSAVGAKPTVRSQLRALRGRYKPDGMILTGQIHDHAARVKSFKIAAEVLTEGLSRLAA